MKPFERAIRNVADTETIWYQARLIFSKDPQRKDYAIVKWDGEIIYVNSNEFEKNPELLEFIRVKLPSGSGEKEDTIELIFSKILARLLWTIHGCPPEYWDSY